jgi:hypothetical protein
VPVRFRTVSYGPYGRVALNGRHTRERGRRRRNSTAANSDPVDFGGYGGPSSVAAYAMSAAPWQRSRRRDDLPTAAAARIIIPPSDHLHLHHPSN